MFHYAVTGKQGKGLSLSLNWDKGEAETEVVVAIAGTEVAPTCRTWNTGITTAPMQGLMEIWYCRIHKMPAVKYKRFHSPVDCFTATAE